MSQKPTPPPIFGPRGWRSTPTDNTINEESPLVVNSQATISEFTKPPGPVGEPRPIWAGPSQESNTLVTSADSSNEVPTSPPLLGGFRSPIHPNRQEFGLLFRPASDLAPGNLMPPRPKFSQVVDPAAQNRIALQRGMPTLKRFMPAPNGLDHQGPFSTPATSNLDTFEFSPRPVSYSTLWSDHDFAWPVDPPKTDSNEALLKQQFGSDIDRSLNNASSERYDPNYLAQLAKDFEAFKLKPQPLQVKKKRNPRPRCAFCSTNGEDEVIYTSHSLKDDLGRTTCPVLRLYRCPRCGNTDPDKAHTLKYCPSGKNEHRLKAGIAAPYKPFNKNPSKGPGPGPGSGPRGKKI